MTGLKRWILLLAALLAGVPASATPSWGADWKAGVAKARITPDAPMPMAGYASRGSDPATGTLTDIWAKVLVLEDAQGKQAALITLDLVGIDSVFYNTVTSKLKERYQWEKSQIAICTSHTHTAPVLGKTLPTMHYLEFDEVARQQVDAYSDLVEAAILKAAGEAFENRKSATISWGSGRATFAVNRRTNREADVEKLLAENKLLGPNDHDVPVLAVKQGDQLAAVVFGYACHNTTLSLMQWSGDYAGFAQIDLEKALPGCQAMYWAGCGADQNPLPRRTVELAMKYGSQLASAVQQVLAGEMQPISPVMTPAYGTVPLPFSHVPSKSEIENDLASSNKYTVNRAKTYLARLANGESLPVSYDYPIVVWRLGNQITWVFLSGEVVVDYAIRLKTDLAGDAAPSRIWVAGYSNDVMAYIPSLRVLNEGGYEGGGAMVYYGLPSPWAETVEDLIVNTVEKLAAPTGTN